MIFNLYLQSHYSSSIMFFNYIRPYFVTSEEYIDYNYIGLAINASCFIYAYHNYKT